MSIYFGLYELVKTFFHNICFTHFDLVRSMQVNMQLFSTLLGAHQMLPFLSVTFVLLKYSARLAVLD